MKYLWSSIIGRRGTMAVHMLMVSKLKLLTTGHGNWRVFTALLCPFILKLSFIARAPVPYVDVACSLRLFLFRLGQICFQESSAPSEGRWQRAMRLFQEWGLSGRQYSSLHGRADTLHAISMLAL